MGPRNYKATFKIAFMASMLIALFIPASLHAQESRGRITGVIMDSNKSAVPGASVSITSTAKGTTLTATSNDEGLFQAPYLIPGLYKVTIEAKGFKKYSRDGIELRVNDNIELEILLEVGAVEQTVMITSETPLLDTTSGSMGQVVDERRIAELPTPHGDPFALIGLTPGATYTGSQRLDRPFEPTHIVGYAIDGTRGNRSDITIDGAPSTATANANEITASFVPPQDAVQEFKVQTVTFDASFGNTEGGVTNISIKSGGNNLNGTLAYTHQTPKLFANDFFANRSNIARQGFYYHRASGTLGGPVYVPKLYDGRNKSFFFYAYEGIKEARPRNTGTPNVPTERMRNGDFSELLNLPTPIIVYNPFTARLVNGQVVRQPFAGNIIPQNLINPVARAFVSQYLARPTANGAADGTGNFPRPDLTEATKYNSHTIRMDHALSDKHRILGRASWFSRDSNFGNYFDNLSTGSETKFYSRQGVIDDVYIFNPSTVLNMRYGYNRYIRLEQGNSDALGFDLTSLGFSSAYNNQVPVSTPKRFPRFDINGYQGTGIGGERRPMDTHSFSGTLNKTYNTHSFKFGVDFRAYRENSIFSGNNQTGHFIFDNTYTRQASNTSNASQTGLSFAAFLLGIPTNDSNILRAASYAEQSTTWGLFVHDDWKFNNRLTLNLGLRYEVEGALTERYNRSVKGFDPNYIQPYEAAAQNNYRSNPIGVPADQFTVRGGLTFAGVNGESRGLYDTPKTNFMPRIGLAYKINDKTVARAGYGIFFGFLGQRRGDVIQTGFGRNTFMNVSTNNGLTFNETLSNPFSTSGVLDPVGAGEGPQTGIGQNISFFNQNPSTSYMQRWEVSLQRELPKGFVIEAAYVGNRGTHIEFTRNINALPNQYLYDGSSVADANTRNTFLTQANITNSNPFRGLLPAGTPAGFTGTTIARQQLLRPFPLFGNITTTDNGGYSWYHSGQLSIQKRFSKGYTIQTSYTFSKFMEALELLNAGDLRPTEMLSPADRPHRLVVSGIYEFPFGKGRPFFNNLNSIVDAIIGGWQINGIYSYQSGPMLEGWPDVVFNGDVKNIPLAQEDQTIDRYFNTDAGFVLTGANNTRVFPGAHLRRFPLRFGFIRADNIHNFDLSMLKNFRITEGTKLQFRFEALNAFNHPLLSGGVNGTNASQINLNPTTATFGAITPTGPQLNYTRRIQLTLKLLF